MAGELADFIETSIGGGQGEAVASFLASEFGVETSSDLGILDAAQIESTISHIGLKFVQAAKLRKTWDQVQTGPASECDQSTTTLARTASIEGETSNGMRQMSEVQQRIPPTGFTGRQSHIAGNSAVANEIQGQQGFDSTEQERLNAYNQTILYQQQQAHHKQQQQQYIHAQQQHMRASEAYQRAVYYQAPLEEQQRHQHAMAGYSMMQHEILARYEQQQAWKRYNSSSSNNNFSSGSSSSSSSWSSIISSNNINSVNSSSMITTSSSSGGSSTSSTAATQIPPLLPFSALANGLDCGNAHTSRVIDSSASTPWWVESQLNQRSLASAKTKMAAAVVATTSKSTVCYLGQLPRELCVIVLSMLPVICDGFEDEGIFSTCHHWSELFETTLPFRRENLLFTPSSLEEFKSIFRSVSPLERVCDSESPNEDLSFGRLCLTIGTRTCSSCFNTFDDTDHWTICEMCGSTVPMPKSAVALRHFILNLSRARHFHTGCMITVETVAQHIWDSFLVAHAPTLEHLEVTACFSILPQSARFTNLRSLVLVVKYDFGGGSSTQTPTSIQESGAWSSLPIVIPNLENLSLIRNHSRYIGSSFFGISPMSKAKASTQNLPPLRPELAFLLKLHRLRELTLEHPFLHPISGLEFSQLFMSPSMLQIEKLCITEDLTKLTERNWRFRYLKTDLVNLKQVILKDVVAPAFVSDLTSRSPNLQFLEVAFPKKIVSDDSWFEVCESLRVNCLQLRDFTHLNTRFSELTFAASASLKNLSHIRNAPLLPCTAPVPIVGIPRWLSSILISTLHVLDLEHCDFKVTSAIASIVSESCLLLRNLTFPRKLGSAINWFNQKSLTFVLENSRHFQRVGQLSRH